MLLQPTFHLGISKDIRELLLKQNEEEKKKKRRRKIPQKNLTTQTLPAQPYVRSSVFSLGNIFARI